MSHPFYGQEILRNQQQKWIETLLKKYRGQPADDTLKQRIWDELQEQKHQGILTIPFKVVLRKDPSHNFPPYIEVILDTKV